MNAFRILDKDGKALTMAELDKEAAEFWGKEVHPKHYANPFPDKVASEDAPLSEIIRIEHENARNNSSNWFDIIGWNIANQDKYTFSWRNVAYTMLAKNLGECLIDLYEGEQIKIAEFVGGKELHLEDSWEIKLFYALSYYKPFVDLINHWAAKGYTPIMIEE